MLFVKRSILFFRKSWDQEWASYGAAKAFVALAHLVALIALVLFYIHICVKVSSTLAKTLFSAIHMCKNKAITRFFTVAFL